MKMAFIYVLILLGGSAFLGMVKIMYDMNGHMAHMTDRVVLMSSQVKRMGDQMEKLTEQVSGIRGSVEHMGPLAEDIHAIREDVGTMTGVIHRGGEQIERLNPMDMMQQMLGPEQKR
jgi:hypothetical protein